MGVYIARMICSDEDCAHRIVAEAETLEELEWMACDCGCDFQVLGVPDHVQETAVVVSLGRYRRRHARPRPPVGEAA